MNDKSLSTTVGTVSKRAESKIWLWMVGNQSVHEPFGFLGGKGIIRIRLA